MAELPWLQRVAHRMGSEDADDLVQDLWLLAQHDRPTPPLSGSLRPWLATAMRNRLRSLRRSTAARSRREHSWSSHSVPPAELEQHAMWVDEARVLDEALATLSEDERALLRERFFHGRSAAELASERGIPAATVRTRLHRSLHRLRDHLDRSSGRSRSRASFAFVSVPWVRALAQGALMTNTKAFIVAGAVAGIAALAWLATTDSVRAGDRTPATAASPSSDGSVGAPSPVALPPARGDRVASPSVLGSRSTRARSASRRAAPRPGSGELSTPELSPSPPTARQCALGGHQNEDCDFIEPDPEVLDAMAECGVVRYDFPAMFVQRDWTPEFEAEWLDLVGAGPTEREQLMDISDAHRRALFSQLSAVGQELGLDPWSDDATLLSVVVELSEVVGDDHVDAALRRIANERAGHSEPPQSRAERPVAERFARIFTAVGTSLEDEIAQQLGEARARELRLAQDGWPGLKYQGGGRECRTEAEAEAESRPDESPSDGSPPQ